MMNILGSVFLALMTQLSPNSSSNSNSNQSEMVLIADGLFEPLFKSPDGLNQIVVRSFYIDRLLVSNGDFIEFAAQHPKWNKKSKKTIFHDEKYLSQLRESNDEVINQPVTHVSWFAARAYCKSKGKRLPTTAEWEYMASASEDKPNGKDDAKYKEKILSWYAQPATAKLPDVDDTAVNYWGVRGVHGVVWEMVNDFNTGLVTGESRGDTQLEQALFCGAGAASSVDPGDYAAFMRYALRSSYEASYTMSSLGFRCAKDNGDKE